MPKSVSYWTNLNCHKLIKYPSALRASQLQELNQPELTLPKTRKMQGSTLYFCQLCFPQGRIPLQEVQDRGAGGEDMLLLTAGKAGNHSLSSAGLPCWARTLLCNGRYKKYLQEGCSPLQSASCSQKQAEDYIKLWYCPALLVNVSSHICSR